MKIFKNRTKIKKMTVDTRISLLLVLSVGIVTFLILLFTTLSTVRSVTQKSTELIMKNVYSNAIDLDYILSSYENTLQSIETNAIVQSYLKVQKDGEYPSNATTVTDTLANTRNVSPDIWGITLIREGDSAFINSSVKPSSYMSGNFLEELMQNYEESLSLQKGSMTYNVQQVYGEDGLYTLNIYRPVFNSIKIGDEIGLLCLRVDLSVVRKNFTNTGGDITERIIGTDGQIIVPAESDEYPSSISNIEKIEGDSGQFTIHGVTTIYQKIEDRNLYLVSEVPDYFFYDDAYTIMFLLLGLTAVFLLIMVFVSRRMIREIFEPFHKLREGMNRVSVGDLCIRLSEEEGGEDVRELTAGFNNMAEKINAQMKEIVEKEREAQKNEIEALQESIKPHFLYNTLECIHWETVAEGNMKASKMVQALAKYYRISLSKGRELITLSLELEHVRSYVMIQNMRFNDTIRFLVNIPEDMQDLMVPKIT
ncbi:MAG TPA: histidine kinase, partial [Lachnospiraceae bacterium]|nr:histidine kinase [Lachnospiraceae bacterium]